MLAATIIIRCSQSWSLGSQSWSKTTYSSEETSPWLWLWLHFRGGMGVRRKGWEGGLVKTCTTLFFVFFWPHCVACGILVPRPGMEPAALAVEEQSFNHWTTGEVSVLPIFELHINGIILCTQLSLF